MLIKHVKAKAEANEYPINLTKLDRDEYDIEKCFKVDGKLLDHMKGHGYAQYHKKTFETMKIKNTEKMRN